MSHPLVIEPIGQTVEIEDGQTILDAALRAGIYLPHACGHGLCGTCKVKILDGEIDHGEASNFALMDFEREEGKCLACCATTTADLVIEADIDEEPDALNLPVQDFVATVSRIENLTPTIKGVWLTLPAGRELRFQAGQYINLQAPGGAGSRAFSLANPPATGNEIELNIRLVPGGKVTSWVHQALKVGAPINLSGPYGRFFVRESADLPLIFLAGGSGLSSPRSMILDMLGKGFGKAITLIHGARTLEELYYQESFRQLAADHANFTYLPVLSDEPDSSAWTGARGFVHDAATRHFAKDFRGHKAYLCGPPAMITACVSALMQGRLFERDITMEKFFSAADAEQVRSPLFRTI